MKRAANAKSMPKSDNTKMASQDPTTLPLLATFIHSIFTLTPSNLPLLVD
jgi:hypothetical protein